MPEAWVALIVAYDVMAAHATANELQRHMQQMALVLQDFASMPHWARHNYPMGLVMAMMLHATR